MNHLGYLSPGKDIDLRLDIDGEQCTYPCRVSDISDKNYSIEINGKDLREKAISEGMCAFMLGHHREGEVIVPVKIVNAETLPILHVEEKNSRSHVRSDGFMRLKYQRIAEEEYLKKRERYLNEINPEYTMEALETTPYHNHHPGAESPMISERFSGQFLNEISLLRKKLYFLQNLVFNSRDIDIFEQKPMKVNLSGSGINFPSENGIQIGDILDLKMVLPTRQFSIVKALGLVLRIDEPITGDGRQRHPEKKAAVKYIAINEENMEAIIECVFTWQRKILREKKSTGEK